MISKIRKEKGITKTRLAELTDINIGHLTHIEKGERNPSHKALRSICSALNIPYEQLLYTYDKELTEEQVILEKIMLGLRTAKGLSYAFLEANSNPSVLRRMLEIKNLEIVEGETPDLQISHIRIPENKFFISDTIIADLA